MNIQELRGLYSGSNLADAEPYFETLHNKFKKAAFHAERANMAFRNLFAKRNEIKDDDPEWVEAELEVEAETEACVQVLNSMPDVVSQIINCLVLNNALAIGEVSINKVLQLLTKDAKAKGLCISIQQMLGSKTFIYIRDFCNTIKHRRLIDKEYFFHADFQNGVTEGIRYLEFQYGNNTHPALMSKDICEYYREQMRQFIIEIGNEINNYFR